MVRSRGSYCRMRLRRVVEIVTSDGSTGPAMSRLVLWPMRVMVCRRELASRSADARSSHVVGHSIRLGNSIVGEVMGGRLRVLLQLEAVADDPLDQQMVGPLRHTASDPVIDLQ